MTRTGLAVAVVLAGVALSGCGDSDGGAESTPAPAAEKTTAKAADPAARRAFLRQAEAVCEDARRRAAPIVAAIGAKVAMEDAAGVAAELRKGLPIADGFLRDMRALRAPKGDEAVIRGYIDIVEEQRGRIPPLVEALDAEDISTIEVLAEELREGNRRALRIARRYGFDKCTPLGLPAG